MEKTHRVLRKKEVLSMVGISDPTLWRWEKEGTFPRRLRLGENSCGWLANEVATWLEEKKAARDLEVAKA